MTEQQLPTWADPSVSPAAFDAQGVCQRQLLCRAGLFGAAFALGGGLPATSAAAADVSGRRGTYTLRIPVTTGDESFHLRLRGSDGKRHGAGRLGASVDPHGPIPHEPGNGDPWAGTWFYSNPIFVDLAGI